MANAEIRDDDLLQIEHEIDEFNNELERRI
jgi:hypothetical protein